VPLNYSDPHGAEASIALIRLPASVPPTSPKYRGPILFNPGAPGNSGVDFVRDAGASYLTLFGGTFDIIGFDPRGKPHLIFSVGDKTTENLDA
jgi:pimeloyl-ACP methyl ester carboxylesterase